MFELVRAAEKGDLDAAVAALARGGKNVVDRPDPRSGWTALTAAAHGGHRAVWCYTLWTSHTRPSTSSTATAVHRRWRTLH